MPVISSFNNRQNISISRGVQGGQIDSRGAGATAKALANTASGIGDIANQYLKMQQNDQAENYKNSMLENKDSARQEFLRSAMTQMDSATGMMPDGRSYTDHVEEFESTYDKDAMDNAPTDVAKRKYQASSAAGRRSNIMGAEEFQFNTVKTYKIESDKEYYSTKGKKLQGVDDELLAAQGTSALQVARESIAGGIDRTASGIESGLYTELEAQNLQKNGSNVIANTYFQNAMFNDRVSEAIEQIDAPVLMSEEDLAGSAGKELATNLGIEGEVEKVVTMPDGSAAYFFQKGNNETAFKMDPNTGEMTREVYPDMQVFKLDAINIEGEFTEAPKMDKYLTVQDKKRHMGAIVSKLVAKKKESNRKLRADLNNAVIAYSATDDTKLRYRPGAVGHYGTDTASMLSARIWASDLPEDQKYDMAGKLYGAILEGEFKDASTWSSPTRSRSMLENVSENIDTLINEFGAEEMLNEKLDTARLKRTTRERLAAVENSRLRQTLSPNYVYQNDAKIGRMYGDFTQAFIDGDYDRASRLKGELETKVKSRQSQLGLPEFAQSVYDDNFLATVSSELNNLMDPRTGYIGANQLASKLQGMQQTMGDDYFQFINALKIKHNLNEDIAYAAIFPRTPEGIKSQALYTDSVINKKVIQSNYVDTLEEDPDFDVTPKGIRQLSRAKIAPMVAQISRGSTTSEREAQIKSLTDAVSSRAMKLGGNVDQAYKELIDTNYLTYTQSDVGFAVPRAELEKANLTDDEYKAATSLLMDYTRIPGIETVPWERYAGGQDLIGASPSQRDTIIKSRFDEGKMKVLPLNNTGSKLDFVVVSDNGSTDPLINDKDEIISVPLKDVKSVEGFNEELNGDNTFWGRTRNKVQEIID